MLSYLEGDLSFNKLLGVSPNTVLLTVSSS
jgi:hypothetical protein